MSFEFEIKADASQAVKEVDRLETVLDSIERNSKKVELGLTRAFASSGATARDAQGRFLATGKAVDGVAKATSHLEDQLRREAAILERIRGPMRDHKADMDQLIGLYRRGAITAAEYTREAKNLHSELARSQGMSLKGPKAGGGIGSGIASGLGGGALLAGGAAGVAAEVTSRTVSLIGDLGRLGDEYTNLSNKLLMVTRTQHEHSELMERTREIANRSRADWATTGSLYARMVNATKELGLGQERTLRLTETISKAFSMSGASSSEASAGMLQLSQALASGRLNGDEFRSISENVPIVLDLISKQLGVTRGALKEMGSEGKLTADVIVAAFEGAESKINAGFAKTAPTLSQSWAIFKNEMTAVFGKLLGESGILSTIVNGLTEVVRALGDVVDGLKEAAGSLPDLPEGMSYSSGTLSNFKKITGGEGMFSKEFNLYHQLFGTKDDQTDTLAWLKDSLALNEKIAALKPMGGAGLGGDNTTWRDINKVATPAVKSLTEQFDDLAKASRHSRGELNNLEKSQLLVLEQTMKNIATGAMTFLSNGFSTIMPASVQTSIDILEEMVKTLGSVEGAIGGVVGLVQTAGGPNGFLADGVDAFAKLLQGPEGWGHLSADEIRRRMAVRRSGGGAAKAKTEDPWAPLFEGIMGPSIFSGTEMVNGVEVKKNTIDGLDDVIEQIKQRLIDYKSWETALGDDQNIFTKMIEAGKLFVEESTKQQEAAAQAWEFLAKERMEDPFVKSMTALRAQATDVSGAMEAMFTNAYSNIENSIVQLVTTGKASFKSLVDSILADLTRLLVRQGIMAIVGALGGGPPAAIGSYAAADKGLFGFASGGSFMVGGSGGTDSQPVAFRATPGERVTVETPEQQAASARDGGSGGRLTIMNVIDPSMAIRALDTPEGGRLIVNAIRQNAPELRGYITGR